MVMPDAGIEDCVWSPGCGRCCVKGGLFGEGEGDEASEDAAGDDGDSGSGLSS